MGLFNKLKKFFSSDSSVIKKDQDIVKKESVVVKQVHNNESRKNEAVERFNFDVKGTFVDERQKTIKRIVKKIKSENRDFGFQQYEGYTNAEIKEMYGDKVYQYQYESLYIARLEDEPNNEYDENAIKINLVDAEGNNYFIGYVPAELTVKIKELRNKYSYYVGTSLRGGKFKKQDYNDYGDDVIVTGTDDYGIGVSVSFWEALPEFMKDNLQSLKETKKLSNRDNSSNVNIGMKFSSNENKCGISFSSSAIGDVTGSTAKDFYVYEWFIKDTGEIFYVGKGRGNRYKTYHDRAYMAEKIREKFNTDTRFIGIDLTEEQAIELESEEMTRILNETNDRLTNRIIPFFSKRDNGYDRSPNTPDFKFETAPTIYVTEIDEYYFGMKHRDFDEVVSENLKSVSFINVRIRDDLDVIYDGDIEKYYDETMELLKLNRTRVLKTQYAKSISAWIYIGDEDIYNYEIFQKNAEEKLGRKVPTYHLIDVWKFLKKNYGEVDTESIEQVSINPVHNRAPLTDIKNKSNWEKGYDEGMPLWKKGDNERKAGNIDKAIELFDKARYNGYDAPALYHSYAMAYRKLKDYDNEIAIIDEAIVRSTYESNTIIIKLKERKKKALALKKKSISQL